MTRKHKWSLSLPQIAQHEVFWHGEKTESLLVSLTKWLKLFFWILNSKESFQTIQYSKTCWVSQYIIHVLFPLQFSIMGRWTTSVNHYYPFHSLLWHEPKTLRTSERPIWLKTLLDDGNLCSWSPMLCKEV